MIKTYRPKYATKKAVYWTGSNVKEMVEFLDSEGEFDYLIKIRPRGTEFSLLDHFDTDIKVNIGDYVLIDKRGKVERIPEEEFFEFYEENIL